MASTQHDPSIVDAVKGTVRDAQELLRSEIALAKAEARQELRRLKRGAVLLAGAAVAGILGVVFLLATIAWALAEGLDWPVWAGLAIVTGVLLICAGVLGFVGRARLGHERLMPLTVDTVKESMQWMRARTS